MKARIIILIGCLINCLIFTSCDKDTDTPSVNGVVEVYLLESFNYIENTLQIEETSVILEDKALLSYADILSYNSNEYFFKVNENAKKALDNYEYEGHGLSFGIVANGELIYTGRFWASYSSMGIDCIVIDPLDLKFRKELRVKLGYPGQIEGSSIIDKRNDERILNIFRSDNKLIE